LNNNVGYLEGSAYPTLGGNTVLTAHVQQANNAPGPFAYIRELQAGNLAFLHANGLVYVYRVEENKLVSPYNIAAVFKHEEYPWLTLVTCEDYVAKFKTYTSRRMVRLMLISVIPEK